MSQALLWKGWIWAVGLGVLVAAGCGQEENHFPMPLPADDGSVLPNRTVSDASVGIFDVAPEFGSAEAGAGDGARDSAGDSTGDASAVMITVTIDEPAPDTLVAAEKRFAPKVTVMTDTVMPSAGDSIKDVSAKLLKLPTKEEARTITLNQIALAATPESNMVTYKFADTPFNLSGLESGPYELVVAAKSVSGAMGEARVKILIDAGPVIRIDAPGDGKYFKGSAPVDITITDYSFGPVQDVRMTIGQVPLMFKGPSSTGQYTATIDFRSFDPPLEGEQLLTVRAKNKNGTEAVSIRKFISDNQGPLITNTIPKVGDLMGRVVTISAEITDPAGVLDSSVKVVIAHGDKNYEFPLTPPAVGAKTQAYTYLFDTSKLPINALFPSITFRASDVLGNESSVGYLVSLDNMPPLADLDPPEDFRSLVKSNGIWRCSWPYDPVGPDAANDGDRVAQLFDIRARIEDQGNDPKSGTADYTPIGTVAGADLLIMDDTSKALLVDMKRRADGPVPADGTKDAPDGYCDDVNPNLTISASPAASPDVLLITMEAINVGGGPDMAPDPNAPCTSGDGTTPEPFCETTFNYAKATWDLSRVRFNLPPVPHSMYMYNSLSYAISRLPAIWTVPPIVSDKVQCSGRQFDALANNLKDGWACVAVRATDKLGNQQISRPLRICIDHDGKGGECPHKAISTVSSDSPPVVTTAVPHGLTSGDAVIVSGVLYQTQVNAHWTADVIDATHFSLREATGEPMLPAGSGGLVVRAAELPDCTGTVTAAGPPATVDATKACKPWRLYQSKEIRVLQ